MRCPVCETLVGEKDNYCFYCGKRLNDDLEMSNAEAQTLKEDYKIFCHFCGKPMYDRR